MDKEHERRVVGNGRRLSRRLEEGLPSFGKNAALAGHTKIKGCVCEKTWATSDGFYCDNYCCVDPRYPNDGGLCFVEDPDCEGHTWNFCNMVGEEENDIAVAANYYDKKFKELSNDVVDMRESSIAKKVLPKLVD